MEENDFFIILDCKDILAADWMAFSFWYSLQKKIPSIEFVISAKRSLVDMFWWAKRIGVKVLYRTPETIISDKKILIFKPTTIAIREFKEDNLGPECCTVNSSTSFISYDNGFGKFNISDWINRKDSPFCRSSKRFYKNDLNYNEIYILNLWDKCDNIYGKF